MRARSVRSPLRWVRGIRAALLDRLHGTLVAVDVDRPWVALTFDDGPHPVTTPQVLEVLARHGARATFFMVGREAARRPDLVAAVAAGGHAIGHHTLDHVPLPGLDADERQRQIAAGFEAVGPPCARLFRPPYGHLDRPSWRAARRGGHEVVAWSGHAFDWLVQDGATLAGRLRAALAPGAIVLLHDAPQRADDADRSPRAALLEALDLVLGETGGTVTFVTLPELLAAGRPRRQARWRGGTDADRTRSPAGTERAAP